MMETTGTLPARYKPIIASQLTGGLPRRGNLYLLQQEITITPRRASTRQAALAAEFKKHEQIWKEETQFFSSPAQIYLHPSYARIIGMGRPAVQLILQSLVREPADWFYALRAITGANPVTQPMAGDMNKMTEAWLKWGAKRDLV